MSASKGRVCHILKQGLCMRELPARWVSHLLPLDQMLRRRSLGAINQSFDANTTDEIWIHHYSPETKIQSKP